MDIWSWICELPNSDDWAESDSPLVFNLATENDPKHNTPRSILLNAERTSGSNTEALVTFSVCLDGFYFPSLNPHKTLWVSDPCPLSADKPFLPLVLQLLQETIVRAPISYDSTCPRSQPPKLKPEPVSWILDSHSPESFSIFFNLVFLCRLFWLCVCDAPADAGSLYMESLLGPNLGALSSCKHVLRTFLSSIGVDGELGFMRTLGYMLAKWLILKGEPVVESYENQVRLGFSYATESHGFWSLKGYAPVLAMTRTSTGVSDNPYPSPLPGAKDFVLTYALAHQQVEAVIQLEYSVGFYEGFIQVTARVDNLRFHVTKLGFGKNDNGNRNGSGYYDEERHFPSRIRVWVGPEIGATYVAGLSLGRSTDNPEREVETQRVVKGNFGKSKSSSSSAAARTSTKTKMKNWRWEQDAEGNAAVFEVVLCDNTSGDEVVTWKPEGAVGGNPNTKSAILRKRYSGASRAFNKTGSVVFARDEYGEEVRWRLSKEMEGSLLKWRIGGKLWLSYWPCNVQSSHFETRCVDWCDEVDLPLIPPGK